MKPRDKSSTRGISKLKRSNLCFTLLPLLVAGLWSATGRVASEKIRPAACAECHEGLDLKAFRASVHGELGCQECHAKGPFGDHEKTPPKVDCGSCHEEAARDYSQSFHGLARGKGISDAPGCSDCHGNPHDIKEGTDPFSSHSRANIPALCARCHADTKIIKKYDIPVADPYAAYKDSVHGRAVAQGNLKAAVCSDCHGAHTIQPGREMSSRTAKKAIPADCGKCHDRIFADFEASIHGQAAARGIWDAPVCTDCHGEHGILKKDEDGSPVSPSQLAARTCGRCHEDLTIAKRYGLRRGRTSSYLASYHGLAVRRGSVTVANCASCHGGHKILPSSDPKSSIHPSRLAETCGSCHPGASEAFARTPVHLRTSPTLNPVLYYVRVLYLWMIAGTIGLMFLHNLLIYGAAVVAKFRRQKTEKGYVRFTVFQLLTHGMLLLSFVTLIVTGFGLHFPDARWTVVLDWLRIGEEARGNIHRAAAVVMLSAGFLHIGHMFFTRKGRYELKELLPRWTDLQEFRDSLKFYVRMLLGGPGMKRPKLGRYSYVHKAEYWALIWGTVIMTATGFALWFPVKMSGFLNLPSWGISLADLIHYYEAWLATLAIAVWHFFFVIFHPEEYPMSLTWLTGKVTREEMEMQHPRELESLKAEGRSESSD